MSDRINRAVDRLANALYELSYRGRISTSPEVRMLVVPGDPKPEDARHLHGVGLTAELAELLAGVVEQLLATAEADDFARTYPELAEAVASTFNAIDVHALAQTVLDDAAPDDRSSVARALNAMFRTAQDQQEDGDQS